jgi:biopolymer transport protein ExbD
MKPLATMNVIPFIDIMLVLLAIVLTTATFVAQGKIPVNLPGAEQSEPMPTVATVEIAIKVDGTVFLDGERTPLESLEERFAGMAADTPVLLRVDGQTAFEHFVGVVDRLKAREMNNLSIVTKRTTD